MLSHHDKGYLRSNTGGAVDALERGGFIVSPKSVLEPATKLVFLGKWLDLLGRMVWSHEVAHLQMPMAWLRLAVWWSQKRLMHSFLGSLHWQVRPRVLACPFGARAYCWVNGEQARHTLVAVLESLVVLQTMAAKPWHAPVARVQTPCLELGLHRSDPVLLGRFWEGPGLVLFVDGAHESPSWRMGSFFGVVGCWFYDSLTVVCPEPVACRAAVPCVGSTPGGAPGLYHRHSRELLGGGYCPAPEGTCQECAECAAVRFLGYRPGAWSVPAGW